MTAPDPPDGLTEITCRVGSAQWGGWFRGDSIRGFEAQGAGSEGGEPARSRQSGAGPTVLLLHGTGGNRETWTPLLATLDQRAAGWNLLMPDLPGHGQTQCTAHAQHGLREMAHDLQKLLLSLGIHRVDLVVGHSAGAAVAIWLGLMAQERIAQNDAPSGTSDSAPRRAPQSTGLSIGRIIGVAPSLVPPPSLYNLILGPLLNPLFVSGLSVSAIALLARNTGMVDRLIHSTGSNIPQSQLEAYRRLFREERHVRGAIAFMAGTDLPTLLRQGKTLVTPLDLLIAEDDPWIPARALRGIAAEYFPRAPLHICQGGHLMHEATPSILASLMHKALE